MRNSSDFLAPSGTRPRAHFAVLAIFFVSCASLLACGSDRESVGRSPEDRDAEDREPEHDAGHADAASDAAFGPKLDAETEYSCLEHSSLIKTFVENHRACASDDDCVIVGDCSHSNFQVVARNAEEAAKKLVFDERCRTNDGPGYFARCRENKCERILSRIWCGSPPQTDCPPGMVMQKTLCGAADPKSYRSGCYMPCNGAGEDGPCASGHTCQKATVDPCPRTPGEGEKWLCAPAASCQVALSLSFDDRSVVRIVGEEATLLKLWLENLTDQPLSFSYELPCNGPVVEGLADYDLWGACLAGACPAPSERVQVTLAARERRLYRSELIELAPTTCNMNGLATGTYKPSFTLANVQGANVCGPAGTLLIAGDGAP